MAKAKKETIFLVSSEQTGYFYCIRQNKKKKKGEKKMSVRKFDPIAGKHVTFEEKSKVPALKKKYKKVENSEAVSA